VDSQIRANPLQAIDSNIINQRHEEKKVIVLPKKSVLVLQSFEIMDQTNTDSPSDLDIILDAQEHKFVPCVEAVEEEAEEEEEAEVEEEETLELRELTKVRYKDRMDVLPVFTGSLGFLMQFLLWIQLIVQSF
jgi:CO dehydrogenase/acetyl-CoA synthase beta subunit